MTAKCETVHTAGGVAPFDKKDKDSGTFKQDVKKINFQHADRFEDAKIQIMEKS